MIPQLPSVIIHVEAFSPTTSPPVFANLSTDKMCFTKTKAFKGRGYNLKRSIVEAGWRWRGGFLQKDFKVLTFAHCIRYFLSLAWKWTCQFYCALKEIFFWDRFVGGCCGTQPKDIAKIRKIRKYWVTINRFDFSLGLYQGPSGFTLIAPCRSQGRGGRRIADWTRITSLVSVNGLFQPIGNKNKSEIYNGVLFCFLSVVKPK